MEKATKTAKKPVKKVTSKRGVKKAVAEELKAPARKKRPPRDDAIKHSPKKDNLEAKVEKLKEEAEKRGLLDNLLYEELLDEFYYQTSLLHRLRDEIDNGELTTQKTYIKGKPNISPNKLIATYNATSNARVNTVGAIAKLVKSFGEDDTDSQDPLLKIMQGG